MSKFGKTYDKRVYAIKRTRNKRVRAIKRAYKIGMAIRKFRKYSLLYALVALVFGLSAWYCISLGTIITIIVGVCFVVVLVLYLAMSALDLI